MFKLTSTTINRIGFDFYADIAERIVARRKELQITREQLAATVKESDHLIGNYEMVRTRMHLDVLRKISDALDMELDKLIGAEFDGPDCEECIYKVWQEKFPELKIFFKATSPQMAFLIAHASEINKRRWWFGPRDRAIVELVGVPIRNADVAMLEKRNAKSEDLIEKD